MSYITLVIKVISIIIVQFTIIYKATIIIITTIFVTPGDLMFGIISVSERKRIQFSNKAAKDQDYRSTVSFSLD